MPYANEAIRIFYEIDRKTEGFNRRRRKHSIRLQEKAIREHFEHKLNDLNMTQGRILVKLINRQLKRNCFTIIRE